MASSVTKSGVPQGVKCKVCDAVIPPVLVNKETLCVTCTQNKLIPLCTKCKMNNANVGYKWCQSCYNSNDKCNKCGMNPPNKGRSWCEKCFREKNNPVIPPSQAVPPPNKTCVCGKPKLFCTKENKWLDFCGKICTQHLIVTGVLKLDEKSSEYISIATKFKTSWNTRKGECPPVTGVFKVQPPGVDVKFDAYQRSLKPNNIEWYFHGCKIKCDLLNSQSLCNLPDCTVCQVSKIGFDITKVGSNVKFTRFGKGLYFAPESSKCHDYTLGLASYGYRAMLYVKCVPGLKQVAFTDNPTRVAPDPGFNSLYGKAGKSLNYDELCLYTDQACIPDYIIIYRRDGVDRRCF